MYLELVSKPTREILLSWIRLGLDSLNLEENIFVRTLMKDLKGLGSGEELESLELEEDYEFVHEGEHYDYEEIN